MSEPGLFANESVPYAPFKTVGTEYAGVVLKTSTVQGRKFVPKNQRLAGKQGELEFWPDGKPKNVSIVTIQTDLRDPEIPDDDGRRSIWISGKQMEGAAKKGVADAGALKVGIKPGGWFRMKFTHETPPEEDGLSPTKHYEVTYRMPETPGAFADPSDPWAQPQNAFPQVDAWGAQVQAPGQPMPQPTNPPPYRAHAQQAQGTAPDTQDMIKKLLQQQGGQQ